MSLNDKLADLNKLMFFQYDVYLHTNYNIIRWWGLSNKTFFSNIYLHAYYVQQIGLSHLRLSQVYLLLQSGQYTFNFLIVLLNSYRSHQPIIDKLTLALAAFYTVVESVTGSNLDIDYYGISKISLLIGLWLDWCVNINYPCDDFRMLNRNKYFIVSSKILSHFLF